MLHKKKVLFMSECWWWVQEAASREKKKPLCGLVAEDTAVSLARWQQGEQTVAGVGAGTGGTSMVDKTW